MTRLADFPTLTTTLQLAVPMWMDQLEGLDPTTRDRIRMKWARDAVEPIASRADALMYGGKRGEAAQVFNHLARALAAMSYNPGGVTFAGHHWCTDHDLCLHPDRHQPQTAPQQRPAVVNVELPGVS